MHSVTPHKSPMCLLWNISGSFRKLRDDKLCVYVCPHMWGMIGLKASHLTAVVLNMPRTYVAKFVAPGAMMNSKLEASPVLENFRRIPLSLSANT